MRARHILAPVVVALALGGGCIGRDAASPPAPPSVSPPGPVSTAVLPQRCPNAADAVLAGIRIGGEVSGDVDGDGSGDVVYLLRDDGGPAGCQTFVIAETAGDLLVAPADEPGGYGLQAPRVHSLVQIDGSGGLEILVDLEQGASTQFLGMFKVGDGTLTRVRFQDGPSYGDLFPYGGSVGHIEASNCARQPGLVVIAEAIPVPRGYEVRWRFYELQDDILRPVRSQRERETVSPQKLGSIEYLAGSPFGACEET